MPPSDFAVQRSNRVNDLWDHYNVLCQAKFPNATEAELRDLASKMMLAHMLDKIAENQSDL